jgi:hypothetical protein
MFAFARNAGAHGGERRLAAILLDPSGWLWYFQRSLSGNNSVVECDLAKVEVAGSNPVSRSIFPSHRAVGHRAFFVGAVAKW